jgi:CII-binding regulator of phage lambda lysogenization HflD
MWKFWCNDSDKLDKILKEIQIMATTLAQLDAALATLTTEVATVVTDVTALIAKINASGNQDFTNEANSVQASIAALQGSDAAAQQVLNPPAPPAS